MEHLRAGWRSVAMPRAAIVTRDEDTVGLGFGNTCSNRADANFGN